MSVKHFMPPATTKFKMAIFRIKVIVELTRSLVSFERVPLVEYTC